jgi:hypothetical protein
MLIMNNMNKMILIIIGSIMYAMMCTRHDVALAVSRTNCFQSNPGMEHWTFVKNILKYLNMTKDMSSLWRNW